MWQVEPSLEWKTTSPLAMIPGSEMHLIKEEDKCSVEQLNELKSFISKILSSDQLGEYTKLEEDQITESPLRRQGTIKFASEDNIDKTVDMLKTFNRMYINNIFATPATLGGSYGSDAFASGRCMFMVCSTGGLSYNTGSWNNRFSITTIPFKDAKHKYVIAQGANICMTNKADKAKAFEVIKGLTTGKFQTEWALQTGYFPASNSAADSEEYDAFLKGTDYSDPTVVAYREGAQINQYEYRDVNNKFSEAEKWHRFVDDAFIGSSVIRQLVKGILGDTFINCPDNNGTPASDDDYKSVLKFYLSKSEISSGITDELFCFFFAIILLRSQYIAR